MVKGQQLYIHTRMHTRIVHAIIEVMPQYYVCVLVDVAHEI